MGPSGRLRGRVLRARRHDRDAGLSVADYALIQVSPLVRRRAPGRSRAAPHVVRRPSERCPSTLVPRLDRPGGQLVLWAPSAEDAALRASARAEARRRRVHLLAPATAADAGASRPIAQTFRARHSRGSRRLRATIAFVLSYYDRVEALLTAIEHVGGDLSDGRSRLRGSSRAAASSSRAGAFTSIANRQAVTRHSARPVRHRAGGTSALEPVSTTQGVEQTFGGLLSSTPPPGPASQTLPRRRRRLPGPA